MGKIIKELKLDCQIICVDTWLGSEEFIGLHEKDPERKLLPTFGYPNAYYQFLANICHNELQDIIIPFPQVIKIACQWLSKKNINADIVYIDGNNDTIDVYNDMTYSWPILNDNGVIFGDDYNNPIWRSINLGVNKFCTKNRVKLTETTDFPNHWIINKKQKSNDSDHLALVTCTYNHTNRIAYFRYLIKNIFTKINNYTWIIIEDGITAIGNDAFANNNLLKTIIIPLSVTEIGDNAFSGCGLENIIIGRQIKIMGFGVYSNNLLSSPYQ
jgi:hypothetical protein